MVNITVFGPWSGKKAAMVEKTGIVHLGPCGMDSYDTEASLLPLQNESRWNRRGKFCCLAVLADICAFLALLLIIVSTGFLLWKVWWVKAEVDRMQPAVASLSASLSRLQIESDALQSENNALINAYSSQTGNHAKFHDTPMEDTNAASLAELDGQTNDQLDDAEAGLAALAIYVAVQGKSDQDSANLVDELKSMYDAQARAGTSSDSDTEKETADTSDTDNLVMNILSNTDSQSDAGMQNVPFALEIPKKVEGDSDSQDDDDTDDTPKTKAKDVAEDLEESDDDDDVNSPAVQDAFSEGSLSDSD